MILNAEAPVEGFQGRHFEAWLIVQVVV